MNELLDEGGSITASEYHDALTAAEALRNLFSNTMAGFDAVLTPPATGEAPATLEETGSPAFCTLWTLLWFPAITIPVALGPAGLPLGLQIVGHFGADDQLLGAAAWCESHLPFEGL